MNKKQIIGFMIFLYSNFSFANLLSWSNSYTPTLQTYEHYTKNDGSTFFIGCGKTKENNFLTLKVESKKLSKVKGVLDFNLSVDGADSYNLKAGFYPNESTIYVTRPPQKLMQEIKKGHIADIEVYSNNELVFKSIYSLSGAVDALSMIYEKCASPFKVL
ncbi:hypothetical protein ACTFQF_00310 [Aliivibrio fischeri]|uniref:Uncharacterized protein n=1 Tax=Aliivibrio fischeri (strain MJ11) TaxID=388396 RepID=B5EW01_ALIFM|nr:hypothetical protein [Aliivibrio fischeri]ACH64637.1 hypothetical protein VFMJ11_B0058 [Aliivibrio fischeri MJ11]MUK37499.1 hypothetical protein [Aliivibrio fischeri]